MSGNGQKDARRNPYLVRILAAAFALGNVKNTRLNQLTNVLTDILTLRESESAKSRSPGSGLSGSFLSSSPCRLYSLRMREMAASEPLCRLFACRRSKSLREKGREQIPQTKGLVLVCVRAM